MGSIISRDLDNLNPVVENTIQCSEVLAVTPDVDLDVLPPEAYTYIWYDREDYIPGVFGFNFLYELNLSNCKEDGTELEQFACTPQQFVVTDNYAHRSIACKIRFLLYFPSIFNTLSSHSELTILTLFSTSCFSILSMTFSN